VTGSSPSGAGRLPRATLDWALFLDVDGTLLDIAETPFAVVVPRQVLVLLSMLHAALDGAVALASGRSIETIDRLFRPLHMPAAGQHGLELRGADGIVTRPPIEGSALERVRERLSGAESEIPGLLIEDKGDSVAVHYRRAPSRELEVEKRVADAVQDVDSLELIPGKKVIEIRPRGSGKDKVVEAFMAEAPFRGRVPVFVGDDRTDEDGFAAVNRLGGHSIRVGADGPSAARYRLASPGAVRDWLARAAAQIVDTASGHDDDARSASQ
jgi:trehalose 6-phosphate phosphatase